MFRRLTAVSPYVILTGAFTLLLAFVMTLGLLTSILIPDVENPIVDEESYAHRHARELAEQTSLVQERIAQIQGEIESITNHDWAGCYFESMPLSHSIRICLAPKNGIAFQTYGCGGLSDQSYGRVTESNGRIRADWMISTDRTRPQEYLAIRWGQRRYLVPNERIAQFCGAVRSRKEPRSTDSGDFLLREGDENVLVDGEPELPVGFEKYLKISPITARVKTLRRLTTRFHEDHEHITQRVTLDVGKTDGILPNMELQANKLQGIHPRIEVYGVTEHESEAEITFWRSATLKHPPIETWALSTLRD